jgi:hypothetical protein
MAGGGLNLAVWLAEHSEGAPAALRIRVAHYAEAAGGGGRGGGGDRGTAGFAERLGNAARAALAAVVAHPTGNR